MFEQKYIFYLLPACFLLSAIFYNLIFFNHTYFHWWSGVKFTVPIAFLVAISSWVIFVFFKKFFKEKLSGFFLIFSSLPAVLLAGYTIKQSATTEGLFPPRDKFAIEYKYLDLVREKLVFSDVVFSYDFDIGQKTLQSAYLSRPVYRIRSLEEITEKLHVTGNNASAVLFYRFDDLLPARNGSTLAVIDYLGVYGDYRVARLVLK